MPIRTQIEGFVAWHAAPVPADSGLTPRAAGLIAPAPYNTAAFATPPVDQGVASACRRSSGTGSSDPLRCQMRRLLFSPAATSASSSGRWRRSHDLSFELRAPARVLGIGGPNGAGKTTLVRGHLRPQPRAIRRRCCSRARRSRGCRPRAICHAGIARTFQLNASFDRLSVRGNVPDQAAYFGRRNRAAPATIDRATRQRADEALGVRRTRRPMPRPSPGRLPVLDRKLLMLARRARHRSEATVDG